MTNNSMISTGSVSGNKCMEMKTLTASASLCSLLPQAGYEGEEGKDGLKRAISLCMVAVSIHTATRCRCFGGSNRS